MRARSRISTLALLAALALACARPQTAPDIVLVTIDTLRRDHVGAYGDTRSLTPALDALALTGIAHEAAYTTMPTTAPAHLSIFTGMLPSEHGVARNGDPLPGDRATLELANVLRRSGYATAAIVTTRLMSPGLIGLRGFEVYDAPRGRLRHGQDAAEAALAWLDVTERRPFFLWVHLYDPHAPYGDADEKRLSFPVDPDLYGFVDPARYASTQARDDLEARYARGVAAADAALGRLLEGLRERLDAPPLVFVVADHGESLGEHLAERGFGYDHGKFLDPETVAIPLVVAGPGVEPGRSKGAVSLADLYGTILAAASADRAAGQTVERDLRRSSDARRIVRIERRQLLREGSEAVRAHAAAATDGAHLAIVADDGTLTAGPAEDRELIAAARAGLGESARPAVDLAPETRRALRELGYAE